MMHRWILYGMGLAWAVCVGVPAQAQTQMVLGNAHFQIGEDQKLMFQAAAKMVNRDYKAAEALYTQAIAVNGSNIEAWLQRGMTRREMGDQAGAASDATTVVNMANSGLQLNPRNPTLYYQRGMGFRILKNFNQAESDIRTGIQQGGQSSWQTDIQAIELEKKSTQ